MNPPKLDDYGKAIGFVILYALVLLISLVCIYMVAKIKTSDEDVGMLQNIGKGVGVLAIIGGMNGIIFELLIPAIRKMNKNKN